MTKMDECMAPNASSNSCELPSKLELHPGAVLTSVFLGFLATFAVLSNACLIWVIAKTPALKTRTNAFVVSIACSDLLFALTVVLPSAVFIHWRSLRQQQQCLVVGSFATLCRCATSFCLMLVSLDRCLAVTIPLRYSMFITEVSVAFMILAAWVLAALMALLPVFGGASSKFGSVSWRCTLLLPENLSSLLIQRCVGVIVPALSISVMIVLIIRSAHRQRRVFAVLPMPGLALAMTTSKCGGGVRRRSTLGAMRKLFLVLSTVCVLWLPWLCIDSIRLAYPENSVYMRRLAPTTTALYFVSFLSCIMNPLVFLINRKYKQRLSELLCRKFRELQAQRKRGVQEPSVSRTASTSMSSTSSGSTQSLAGQLQHRVLFIDTRANLLQVPTFVQVCGPSSLSDRPVITRSDIPDIVVSSEDGLVQPVDGGLEDNVSSVNAHQLTIRVPRVSLSTI